MISDGGVVQGPSSTSGLVSPGGTDGLDDLRAIETLTAHDAITFAVRDNFPELWAQGDDIAAVALAALAASGFAVVQLPEPDAVRAQHIAFGHGGNCECCPPWVRDEDLDLDYSVSEAHDYAAALLLAASSAVTGEDQ